MTPPRRRGNPDDGWIPPDWSDGFPPGPPIRVEGGLVARSARGGIGREWWSRRFTAVMESFALGGRLTRGRNYARRGQVISLDVEPGLVSATVQGSRVTPYRVKVGLATFTELTWAKAEVVIAEQAIHTARLLAGDFPPELEPVFEGIGASLFPRRLGELALSCSCPDHAVPCKHLAATFYLLAERFDDDPFLILRWRGRSREALLARLRALRGDEAGAGDEPGGDGTGDDEVGPGAGEHAAPGPGTALSAALALARPGPGDTAAPGDFWTAGEAPPLPSQPPLPVDFLLRQLPAPPPALGGPRLLDHLAPVYGELGATEPASASELSASPIGGKPGRGGRKPRG